MNGSINLPDFTTKDLKALEICNNNVITNIFISFFIISKRNNDIIGVLGFINTSNYDNKLSKENIIWLALLQIKDNLGIPGLGLKMLRFL